MSTNKNIQKETYENECGIINGIDGTMAENNILLRGFLLLFMALMVIILVACIYGYHGSQFALPYIYVYIAVIAITCLAAIYAVDTGDARKEYVLLFLITAAGVFARWIACLILDTEPISDFNGPFSFYTYYKERGPYTEVVPWTQRDFFQYNYSIFPAWFPYVRLVMVIYDLFGENINHIIAMNMLLASASFLLIYVMIPNKKVALMAVALFSFMPSMVVYSCITTPDHVTIFLILLSVFLWMQAEKHRDDWQKSKKAVLLVLGTSVCCSLVNWFKPLSVLYLVAFVCYEAAVHLYPAIRARMPFRQMLTRVLSFELAVLLILGVSLYAGQAILENRIESMMKSEVLNATPLYILWGCSADGNGNYDPAVASEVYEEYVIETDHDYAAALEMVGETAREWLRHNLTPQFWRSKILSAFSTEFGFYSFANSSSVEGYSQMVIGVLQGPLLLSMNSYMCILYIMVIGYILYMLISKRIERLDVYISIVTFGYLLVLMIGGVQSRYKSLILPLLCILAARSLWKYIGIIRQLLERAGGKKQRLPRVR